MHIKDLHQIQPFRPSMPEIPLCTSDVLQYQKKYIRILERIKGATLIDGLAAFCPNETCPITDENGLPLYADDNHLSRWTGARLLVERVLKPYLTATIP
jgi:hypothetical protein